MRGVVLLWCMLYGMCLHASIILDELGFDQLATRTQYVGTLSLTSSAGRQNPTDIWQSRAIRWSPDANYIGVGQYNHDGNGYEVIVYQNKNLQILAQVDVTPTGNTGLFGTGNVAMHNLSWAVGISGKMYLAVPFYSLALAADSAVLVYEFDGVTLQQLSNATVPCSVAQYLLTAEWSPNGQYLAVSMGEGPSIWSFDGSQTTLITNQLLDNGTAGTAKEHEIAWSYDGNFFATLDKNSNPRMFSFNGSSITLITTLASGYTSSSWWAGLRFHPSQRYFVVGRYMDELDSNIHVLLYSYDTAGNPSFVQRLDPGDSGPWGVSVCWSPDGNYLITGNHTFSVYSFANGMFNTTPVATQSFNTNTPENCAEWSPDGRYLALGSRELPTTSVNGIASLIQLWNTNLNPTPSLTEAKTQAGTTITNIVTSTADQYWGVHSATADLMFSSTEASITRMRGQWVRARCQGSLTSSTVKNLLISSLDNNFYALDQTGGAHVATSVVVGPQTRINWQRLSNLSGQSPVLMSLYQGTNFLYGSDSNKVIYRYKPSVGWVTAGGLSL